MKLGGQPTVSDVARAAGVGTTTVSRVINGGERVSVETFAAVTRAITELGFVPNLAARMLKGERSKTIGLIVPSIADPFFASCAETIQTIARGYGCLVVVCATGNEAGLEMENIETLCRRVDGILITPSHSSDKALIARLTSLQIPVVFFDQPLEGTSMPGVLTNNFQSAKAMTQHLLGHGYEQILCIGGEATFHSMAERTRGYLAAMKEAKRTPMVDTVAEIRTEEDTARILAKYFGGPTPPRAIFCLKNITTIQTYDVLQKFGIRVPEQVALAGHDDFRLAATLRPSVTVVQQPVEEIGRIAAKLLFDRLLKPQHEISEQTARPSTVRLHSRLVFRASCGCDEVKPTERPGRFKLPA
jgi:LacI family transcriptional regulator